MVDGGRSFYVYIGVFTILKELESDVLDEFKRV